MKQTFISAVFLALTLYAPDALSQWKTLESGIALGTFHSPLYPEGTDAHIRVVRIDPSQHELHLFNASHPKQGKIMSAKDWAQKENLKVVINAAMYQEDYKSSVSLMITHGHVNNPRISKDKTVLVFHPRNKKLPPVRIVDMQCDDFNNIRSDYRSMVQSIRMLSCRGKNVWQESLKRWSIAAVGIDSAGNVLFMHVTAPHSVHEFINVLKKLPLSLERAMYMEGGSPAQLFVQTEKDTLEFPGNFSSGGRPSNAPHLPNVLGVR